MTGGRACSVDVDALVELREVRGLSQAQIATRLGVKVSTVNWQCLKHGIERRGVSGPVRTPDAPPLYYRRGVAVRRFTREEDARILALAAEGASWEAIGRALGRRGNSIGGRLYTLARHEARSETPGL